MQTTFLHCADIHLGYNQYQSDERFNDFTRAFDAVVADAIGRRVACVLIAGDLFHKRAIDAQTLIAAQDGLEKLQEAGIPALAIEGNHDRAYFRDGGTSWLWFLAMTGKVALLTPTLVEGEPRFVPWTAEKRAGGFYDVAGTGVRVYGLPWYGASTAAMIARTAAALAAMRAAEDAAGVTFRVLMLHAGVDGEVPRTHGLPTRAQFEPLRGLVDYVALGHIHKPYALGDWLMNPGSIETVSAEEWDWKRGYYVVTVEPGATPPFHAEHVVSRKRRFVRWVFHVEGVANPEEFYDRFASEFARRLRRPDDHGPFAEGDPVIDVALRGTLSFDPGALDRRMLEEIIRRQPPALLVKIQNDANPFDAAPGAEGIDGRDRATWQALERVTLRQLLERDSRYAAHATAWAEVVAALKQHALDSDPPEAIATWLAEQRARIEGDAG